MKLDINKIQNPRMYENGFTKLKYLQIDFTGKCNDSCRSCCGVANHRGTDIPFEKAVEIIDSTIGEMNMKEIFVGCQAEFMLYDYNLDLIDYIEDTYKGVTLRQDTNGLLIPEGFIERLNTLRNNYYDLSISFWNGNKEDYEAYHNRDKFDQVISNIKTYLTELKNPNITFRFSTVYWSDEQFANAINKIKEVVEEFGKTIVEIDNVGLDTISKYTVDTDKVIVYKRCSYSSVQVPNDFTDDSLGLIEEKEYTDEYGQIVKYKEQMITRDWNGIRKPVPFDNNCTLMNNSIVVRIDGGICSCLGNINSHDDDLGNIYNQKVTADWFRTIYNSEKRKSQQVRNATTGAFPHCHKCISRICF